MKRPVQAIFYRGSEIVRTNNSSYPNNAVVNAIRHMQVNQYNADVCEVFNSETGKLYAVVKWTMVGTHLAILYRAGIEEFNYGN